MQKDEIKEILYELNDMFQLSELEQQVKDIEKILDYINNLQEENERLNLELSGYRKAILNDDNLLGLKSKIDKAVEYIENDLKSFLYSIEYKTLLNILNGGDDNE